MHPKRREFATVLAAFVLALSACGSTGSTTVVDEGADIEATSTPPASVDTATENGLTESTPGEGTAAAEVQEPATGSDESDAGESSSGDGDVGPPPFELLPGELFATTVSGARTGIRPGETRSLVMVVENLSPESIDYTLDWNFNTRSTALSVTSVLPETLTIAAGASVEIPATVTADAAAVVAEWGSVNLEAVAVDEIASNFMTLGVGRLRFDVVDPAAAVGPAMGRDLVLAPVGGVTVVDVVANDRAGDAAVDPASLSVLTQPEQGSISVTPEGLIAIDLTTVTAIGAVLNGATYEICDINATCNGTTITIQTAAS